VKEYLSRKGVPFVEKNVAADPIAAQEMMRKTRQRGVPVITIDDQVVIGFDRRALDQILAQKQATKPSGPPPSLGLKVADAARIAQKQALGLATGAYVGAVEPNSSGARAGLQPGDIITALNGRAVGNAEDVARIMSTMSAGQELEIFFLRGGKGTRATVTL